ncbi:hypothetical protein M3Y99_00626300 [Aphelenchoides fujianensis]|nr:hypothetical protein M3Y99_00626300 [Aphelenchoides fujianensis]
MTVCFPMWQILRRFRCPSRGRKSGKRPETFLTPYEMEMVPLMLKELHQIHPRFFETVSFRWFKEAVGTSASQGSNASCILPPATMHEFENEGAALEDLVRCCARTLMEKGTFDDECEQQLSSYRRKREQWRCTNSAVATTATLAAPTLLRSRSFSAAVAAPPISAARFCGNFCGLDEEEDGKVGCIARQHFHRLTNKHKKLDAARQADAIFVQLGEVLVHQFQCTMGAIDKDGSVHERELQVLIWRHFVQMLVTVLTDRARFPHKKPGQRF